MTRGRVQGGEFVIGVTSDDAALRDRAAGAMIGLACGDALAATNEFGPPLPADTPVAMAGGGLFEWEAGEWTDHTAMAIPILRAAADGADLREESTLDRIVAEWLAWMPTARDVGPQTVAVLNGVLPRAHAARAAAQRVHLATGMSAGSGSLMRTAPVALAYIHDPDPARVAAAARAISDLTHYDHTAGDACVIWSICVWTAIRSGECGIVEGIEAIPMPRRTLWSRLIAEAEVSRPEDFPDNGWVVEALQAAWSAIAVSGCGRHGPDGQAGGIRQAVTSAVRGGHDADTVAALVGSLLAAARGASAIPQEWVAPLHGSPGFRGRDLASLAVRAASRIPVPLARRRT